MSISIDDFSDPAFDVKAWVNRAAAGYVDERPRAFDSALFASSSPERRSLTSPPSAARERRCPSQDPEHVEKHLAEVEMKLQLMAEDISLALEEQSVSGLRRIPRAVAEIDRVEHDTKSLQSRIQGILRRLDDAEGASRDSVRTLASVDKVKARMEHARETLANAAGLAELVASVDAVAATGDVRHIADVLASMRRGLRVVGDVPEFADAPSRVEVLEKRVETLAKPELVSALAASDTARAEEMRDVLHVSGKIQTVFSAYAETRVVEPLLREWKAFSGETRERHDTGTTSFASFVPGYAAAVAEAVRRETAWTSRAFPKEADELVVCAWRELSERTKREFAQRAATKSLDLFAETYVSAARGFEDAARALLVTESGETTGVAPAAALGALAAALAPFEGVRARYAELEERALGEDDALAAALAAADRAARAGDAEATAAAAATATAGLEAAAAAATARCEKLADGLETRAMLRALDAAAAARVRGVCVALRRLRLAKNMAVPPAADEEEEAAAPARVALATTAIGAPSDGSAEATARAALRLLAASAATTSRVETLIETIRSWLKRVFHETSPKSALARALPATPSSDLPVPRGADAVTSAAAAAAANADEARALRAFFADASAVSDPLPLARVKARAFADATRAFALETLASRALREFAGYARRPAWVADADADADGRGFGDLPSFSAYPQEAVTNAGEYLLSLPQTLEQVAEAREMERAAARAAAEALGSPGKPAASSDAEAAEGPEAAAADATDGAFGPELDPGEWMADVARHAADALCAEIRGVTRLSETGAAQLAADAEYFANVVAALAPEPHASTLASVAACCATPRDAYGVFSTSEEGAAHGDVVTWVANVRNIAL